MRVLVTGASGFSGGCVARRLAETGFEVIAVARSSPIEGPAAQALRTRFRVIEASGDFIGTLPTVVDAVVHAAATSIWAGISVDRMLTDNVRLTQDLVAYAMGAGARRFIFFSSISAFGAVKTASLNETNHSIDPDAYGATKLLCEQLLVDVADRLPSLSIRLPSVIGRGAKRNWPSECLRKLRGNEPLSYFNPNARYNNLIHERDVTALVATALRVPLSKADMVVVGSAGEMLVAEVVSLLREATGSASPVTVVDSVRPVFVIDYSKAAAQYGFAPMRTDDALRLFATDNLAR